MNLNCLAIRPGLQQAIYPDTFSLDLTSTHSILPNRSQNPYNDSAVLNIVDRSRSRIRFRVLSIRLRGGVALKVAEMNQDLLRAFSAASNQDVDQTLCIEDQQCSSTARFCGRGKLEALFSLFFQLRICAYFDRATLCWLGLSRVKVSDWICAWAPSGFDLSIKRSLGIFRCSCLRGLACWPSTCQMFYSRGHRQFSRGFPTCDGHSYYELKS
ncbi:hypothetical protein DFH06DRAFT_685973 [Mycena polygramma]|nr:hypothetical protein DFH06DRAFT_685973 [Mycena polygramma]